MRKPDDSTIDTAQHANIRKHARRALEDASALGRYPTPVADVMACAKVLVSDEDVLDETFLSRLRRKVSAGLKRALSKVIGVLDIMARLAYIDRTVHVAKQPFLKLHETAHAVLPHQRCMYALVEDCEKTLDPEISELFDREANVFASEVLFQLDSFIDEARDHEFGILVPVRLSKKYGASLYASIRQYVCKHDGMCCVLVLNPPELRSGHGFVAGLRRVICSPEFERQFGKLNWPDQFTPDDRIGAIVPVGGRKMSRPRPFSLEDRNGTRHECLAEAFTQKHQVFVLIHVVATLTRRTMIMP